jgi:hypothetical protein
VVSCHEGKGRGSEGTAVETERVETARSQGFS